MRSGGRGADGGSEAGAKTGGASRVEDPAGERDRRVRAGHRRGRHGSTIGRSTSGKTGLGSATCGAAALESAAGDAGGAAGLGSAVKGTTAGGAEGPGAGSSQKESVAWTQTSPRALRPSVPSRLCDGEATTCRVSPVQGTHNLSFVVRLGFYVRVACLVPGGELERLAGGRAGPSPGRRRGGRRRRTCPPARPP